MSFCPGANCTFSENTAKYGGALSVQYYSYPTLTNCILWGDTPDEIQLGRGSEIDINYSDVEGGWRGKGNIDLRPIFVNPAIGDLHLIPGSPCINVGTNDAPDLPSTDFDGEPRIICDIADMGADEVPEPGCDAIVFVRGDCNADGIVNIADPIYNLCYQFQMGPSTCLIAQDTNDDEAVDLADAVYNISYQFNMKPPPAAPFPDCGEDPTAGGLPCLSFPACP